MQRYDRRVLIHDGADSALGAAALALIAQGLDPLYCCHHDEAFLLARQDRARLAALVVPGSLGLPSLDALLAEVVPSLPGGAAAVVVVGPPRQRAQLSALRDRGIRWVVFEPYDASELRFAVSAALASGDALEPRRGLRVPIRLPTSLRSARVTREGELRNLSVGGAYVALADPPEPGASVLLEFPIGERLLRCHASVAHRRSGRGEAAAEPGPGMGVAFRGLSPLEERLVEGFVRERVESFRV